MIVLKQYDPDYNSKVMEQLHEKLNEQTQHMLEVYGIRIQENSSPEDFPEWTSNIDFLVDYSKYSEILIEVRETKIAKGIIDVLNTNAISKDSIKNSIEIHPQIVKVFLEDCKEHPVSGNSTIRQLCRTNTPKLPLVLWDYIKDRVS